MRLDMFLYFHDITLNTSTHTHTHTHTHSAGAFDKRIRKALGPALRAKLPLVPVCDASPDVLFDLIDQVVPIECEFMVLCVSVSVCWEPVPDASPNVLFFHLNDQVRNECYHTL